MKRTLFRLWIVSALLVALAIAAAPVSAQGYSTTYHRVCWGETLSGIAWRYGTSVWRIAQDNGLWNPNCIRVGQVLVINQSWGCSTCGDHGFKSAPMHRPAAWYVVKCGDTLSGIAWRNHCSIWSLANANGISNMNNIYAGQRLYIP